MTTETQTAKLVVELGDVNKDNVADVTVALTIGGVTIGPFSVNLDAGRALRALLEVVTGFRRKGGQLLDF